MKAHALEADKDEPGVLDRVMVISDIHSNLEALQAVLSRAEALRIWCLGDIVGYGADPNEVIKAIREHDAIALMGNHDYAAVTGDTGGFNARAAMTAKWTKNTLTEESAAYLRSLPAERRVQLGNVPGYLAHGSPDSAMWEYVEPRTHSELFGHYLQRLGVKFVGLGHTHVPYVEEVEGVGTVFNPGSVGQPRDGDSRAAYAVLSLAAGGRVQVEELRVEYDLEGAASKIIAAGLPPTNAERLYRGM